MTGFFLHHVGYHIAPVSATEHSPLVPGTCGAGFQSRVLFCTQIKPKNCLESDELYSAEGYTFAQ
jgi:hypothetical protein